LPIINHFTASFEENKLFSSFAIEGDSIHSNNSPVMSYHGQARASDLPKMRLNLGLMGHVDSGKTTLAKALSTYASTAAFDKHPQSQERGITLDLGFSAFLLPIPLSSTEKTCLVTLVDCPGHASLLRTVIGGVGIVDMVLLTVDVTKGVQTQTAESLLIANMATQHLMIVLTKSDMLSDETRVEDISTRTHQIRKVLSRTRFSAAPIITISALHGHLDEFRQVLADYVVQYRLPPQRPTSGDVLCQVDHCFSVRGQGTVFTGTLIRGTLRLGDTIEIASLGIERKIKSLQIFKHATDEAFAGDRIGLTVTPQVSADSFERGILCTPKSVPTVLACLACLRRIMYYRGPIVSRQSLFHITVGHETSLGRVALFSDFSPNQEDEEKEKDPATSKLLSHDYIYEPDCNHDEEVSHGALIEFEKPLRVPLDSLIVISKLDSQLESSNQCRLALFGRFLCSLSRNPDHSWHDFHGNRLRVFRWKQKSGKIDRILDSHTLLIKDMFSKPEKIQRFLNEQVILRIDESATTNIDNDVSTVDRGDFSDRPIIPGIIQSAFGQTGKIKVYFNCGHQVNESDRRTKKFDIQMRYKKYLFPR
jgi:selenocysteine-specific elongation factor